MTRIPVLLSLAACAGAPETSISTQAMEGRIFKAELALDAPWRIEPEEIIVFCEDPKTGCAGPTYRYGEVPIVVSIRDSDREWSPYEVHSVEVVEIGTPFSRHFELAEFHEIEWTKGHWPWPLASEDFELPESARRLCRLWQGDECPEARTILPEVSEWDGLLFYDIQQPKVRGKEIRLELRLNYKKREVRLNPDDDNDSEVVYYDDVFENEVVVRLGDAPLPRFGTGWAYGDLHYHSQGTDNEGESGYGHRATLHAVSALGLDFVLATEHASSSGQFAHLGSLSGAFDTLRDMSVGRFRTLRRRINDPDGANAQINSFPRRRNPWELSLPQIFLGGEVDAYPEVAVAEALAGTVAYGSTGRYALNTCDVVTPAFACDGLADLLSPKCTHGGTLQPSIFGFECTNGAELRFAVSDLQGVKLDNIMEVDIKRSRQHMVYFPADPMRDDAFIASHTSTWGGGTRSLEDILREELLERGKGAVFLAHPNDLEVEHDGAEKRGLMRLGPDIIPYSEAQLRDAFASEHMLGLEAWNEDGRLRTPKPPDGVIASADGLTPFKAGTTRWQEAPEQPLVYSHLHHGLATWDRMLRWGIDPARTANLAWLPAGRVRRTYFAAGSDAHGDLDYRRAGYMTGIDAVNDTAIGKPRNLVYVGAPRGTRLGSDKAASIDGFGTAPVTQGQVLEGLRAGQFIATDGPIVRVAIDMNGNDRIDDDDVPMGGEGSYMRGLELPIVVEWKSTAEFGPVTRIELVLGAHNDKLGRGMTFAPAEHAVRTPLDPNGLPFKTFQELGGAQHTQLDDEYWLDPTGGLLKFTPPSDQRFEGRRTIRLRPSQLRIGIAVDLAEGPRFLEPAEPDRIYVRAFAATSIAKRRDERLVCEVSHYCEHHPHEDVCGVEPDDDDCAIEVSYVCDRLFGCAPRFAFSNPVWAKARRAQADPGDLPPGEVK